MFCGSIGVMEKLYSAGASLFASVHIVFHAQMILGVSYRCHVGLYDFDMATVMLYLVIIQPFSLMLYLLGDRR